MYTFIVRRAYLELSDSELDALAARTKPRWAPCVYFLIALQFLGPAVLVLGCSPLVFQLPQALRLVCGVVMASTLWLGPKWLGRVLKPLRVASVKVAMLRQLALADSNRSRQLG